MGGSVGHLNVLTARHIRNYGAITVGHLRLEVITGAVALGTLLDRRSVPRTLGAADALALLSLIGQVRPVSRDIGRTRTGLTSLALRTQGGPADHHHKTRSEQLHSSRRKPSGRNTAMALSQTGYGSRSRAFLLAPSSPSLGPPSLQPFPSLPLVHTSSPFPSPLSPPLHFPVAHGTG
eukprot:4850155-Pyramimonas_sp.AAC.1